MGQGMAEVVQGWVAAQGLGSVAGADGQQMEVRALHRRCSEVRPDRRVAGHAGGQSDAEMRPTDRAEEFKVRPPAAYVRNCSGRTCTCHTRA